MNERTTLEIIAPTVEEALAQGLAQLGLPATAVSVEVLDSGNKGLFGLGGRQVRVRLTVNGPEQATAAAPAASPEADRQRRKGRANKEEAPSKPAKEEKARPEKAPAPKTETKPEAAPRMNMEGHDELLDAAEATVSKMLYQMGLQAQVSAHYGEAREDRHPIMVDIRGSDLGVLIGRRGETLNAFQYIASLMVGNLLHQFVQLIVDVEGHRDRRERQLRQLARRMAEQVTKSGRKLTLEPMPASERRIIHMELRDHPAVMTQSTGEEPHRKVMIIPKE